MKHTTKVDWGQGLMKYVCGCRQVMGEVICPIHQQGITETKKKKKRTVEQIKAEEWLQGNAMMYRGDNASDCIMAAYKAGYVEALNTRTPPEEDYNRDFGTVSNNEMRAFNARYLEE